MLMQGTCEQDFINNEQNWWNARKYWEKTSKWQDQMEVEEMEKGFQEVKKKTERRNE